MFANGYDPVSTASRNRGSPSAVSRGTPSEPAKGGCGWRSITRMSGFARPPPARCIETNVNGNTPPLFGRLNISQSRKLPQPPSDTVPVPMPPSGNAISRSESFVKRRPGAGPEDDPRCALWPRAIPDAAVPASRFRLLIFIRLPQSDVPELARRDGKPPGARPGSAPANRGERDRLWRSAPPENPPPED